MGVFARAFSDGTVGELRVFYVGTAGSVAKELNTKFQGVFPLRIRNLLVNRPVRCKPRGLVFPPSGAEARFIDVDRRDSAPAEGLLLLERVH